MSTAVRPAATVVVLRPRDAEDEAPELYMLRRSGRSAFMPDALVFPGGRVEAEDGDDPDNAAAAFPGDGAFAQAARRECIEEASLAVEVASLRWFDTWKTPRGEAPRRFLARFYLALIPAHHGHDAVADGEETHTGRWASAATILDQWRNEQVDLPVPTLCILLRLAAGDWRSWLERSPESARDPILPKITPHADSVQIVMPHDPEYAALPGEAGPVPERVSAFPRRFTRVGKRWVPQP